VLALGTESDAIAFLVSAGIVYEIIAKDVSSPQTCELNAADRAPTLMKWVHVGQAEAAVFIGLACYFQPAHAKPILLGGVMAGVITEVEYLYARRSGLKNPGPPTEHHAASRQAPALSGSVVDQSAIGGATAALVSSAL
jgi:hypothetical protein